MSCYQKNLKKKKCTMRLLFWSKLSCGHENIDKLKRKNKLNFGRLRNPEENILSMKIKANNIFSASLKLILLALIFMSKSNFLHI